MSSRTTADPQDAPEAAAAPRQSAPRLEIADLSVSFGGLTALQDVSFSVGTGEIVALIGPNGAGKTTVFNAVCALVRSRGTIRIDGAPAPRRTSDLASVGVSRTLQGLGLFDGLTVRENIALPVVGRADAAALVQERLAALGLDASADRPVASLAYPDRKRVALARALVTRPALLLLDEPAGGLGAEDIATLADTIRDTARSGTSVLLVEHHVDFVMSLADRIVVLDFGRVIAHGDPDHVRHDPQVEAAYLGVGAAA